jgi:hypothetical protein
LAHWWVIRGLPCPGLPGYEQCAASHRQRPQACPRLPDVCDAACTGTGMTTSPDIVFPSTLAAEVTAAVKLDSGLMPWAGYPYRMARYGVDVDSVDWRAVYPVTGPCPQRVELEDAAGRLDPLVASLTAAGVPAADAFAQAAMTLELSAQMVYLLGLRDQCGLSPDWLDELGECGECDACADGLSAFNAASLSDAALFLADDMSTDMNRGNGSWDETTIGGELPAIARPFLSDPAWFVQLVHAFHLIAARLAVGHMPYPRCTGEEMALHVALAYARSSQADDELAKGTAALEDGTQDDWEYASEWLFEDHDVLMLFHGAFDGIEDSELGTQIGVASLHPRDWFIPFRP